MKTQQLVKTEILVSEKDVLKLMIWAENNGRDYLGTDKKGRLKEFKAKIRSFLNERKPQTKRKQENKDMTISDWIAKYKPSARLANIIKHCAFFNDRKYIHQITHNELLEIRGCGSAMVEEFKTKLK